MANHNSDFEYYYLYFSLIIQNMTTDVSMIYNCCSISNIDTQWTSNEECHIETIIYDIKNIIPCKIDSDIMIQLANRFKIHNFFKLVCSKYFLYPNTKPLDLYKIDLFEENSTIMFIRTMVGLERYFFNFFNDDGHLRAIYFKSTHSDKLKFKQSMRKFWAEDRLSKELKRTLFEYIMNETRKNKCFGQKIISICENIEFSYFF
jgi:hypothetical protein